MNLFDLAQHRDHEAVLICSDKETGLKAFIALHDTTLGPGLGGCRMKPYASEEEALRDVLDLSRAMTFKNSMAGLNFGGAKTVMMIDGPQDKTPERLKALAERIALLGGNYYGAGDVGSDTRDLKIMHDHCRWIGGLAKEDGGLGDSAILTSLGVFMGIRASAKEKFGRDDLDGLKVAVQGAGKVGFLLISHLLSAGCQVTVSDPNAPALERVRESHPEVTIVPGEELYQLDVDIFSPNAIGGVINESIAKNMKAKIVAGGANNPLTGEETARVLHERGILYAPDFVINCGGVIMIASEIEKLTFADAQRRTEAVYDTTLRVFDHAKTAGKLPWDAARELALKRVQEAAAKKNRNNIPALL